jgi:hypothetical protein
MDLDKSLANNKKKSQTSKGSRRKDKGIVLGTHKGLSWISQQDLSSKTWKARKTGSKPRSAWS